MKNEIRPRIAVIDDEPDFRAIVTGWLRPRYDAMGFEDAEELLEEGPEEVAPDLIISDVKMPGLNGFKFCEVLRRDPRLGRVPVLLLTGVDSDEGFLLGLEAGATAYLTKPVERLRLLETVRKLLADSRVGVRG